MANGQIHLSRDGVCRKLAANQPFGVAGFRMGGPEVEFALLVHDFERLLRYFAAPLNRVKICLTLSVKSFLKEGLGFESRL